MSDAVAERPVLLLRPERLGERGPSASSSGRKIIARIVLIVLSLRLLVFPFYWMVVTTLKTTEEMRASPPTLWPHELVWQNFADAVTTIPVLDLPAQHRRSSPSSRSSGRSSPTR